MEPGQMSNEINVCSTFEFRRNQEYLDSIIIISYQIHWAL